jgi:enoyl-CoA hydratase/carnithine racemase
MSAAISLHGPLEDGGTVPEEPELLVEELEGYAVLTMNRPERQNALTASLLESLAAAVASLEQDNIRCIILRGTGNKAFSVGMDLSAMAVSTPEANQRLIGAGGPLRDAIAALEDFPYPVIAMIHGYALGAACELAVSCDLRVGCGQARMGMPPAKLGIVYPPEGLERFVKTLGLATARRLFYTARYFETGDLYAMGVLDFVCGEEIEGFTKELAREISHYAPLSMKGHKTTLRAIAGSSGVLDDERRKEVYGLVKQAMESKDATEGLKSFVEKRPPRFKGY